MKSNSNIFRDHSEKIKEHFLITLIGQEDVEEFYVPATLPRSWLNAFKNIPDQIISQSDYETRLTNYFENPNTLNTKFPLVVLVGDVGSGKSTSVRYALKKSNICTGCSIIRDCNKNYPSRILVDFISFKQDVESILPTYKKKRKSKNEKFWYHIITILDQAIEIEFNKEQEILQFWPWLINEKVNSIPISIYRLLYAKRELINNPTENNIELLKLRERLHETLKIKDYTYYKLFQIAYLRKAKRVNCNFILFDNIDTLPAYLQSVLIDFSLEAHRLLSCKIIIPVRPDTFIRNKAADDFIEQLDHWKPSLKDVFNKRIFISKDKLGPEIHDQLKKTIDLISNNGKYSRLFVATSGRSIRFGLRNFYNFLLSPLIITHVNGEKTNKIELDSNRFFQAYFCGESEDQMIDEENFINLFSIRISKDKSYLSTIKLRLLMLLMNNNILHLKEITDHLHAFDYTTSEIKSAINDFLNQRKALMWSSRYNEYSKKELKNGEDHTFKITRLGVRYFRDLLSCPMYMRECLNPIVGKRDPGLSENLKRIYEFFQLIEDLDIDEVDNYLSINDKKTYDKLYSKNMNSISIWLWNQMKEEIMFLHEHSRNVEIDFLRDNYIRDKLFMVFGKYAQR